MILEGNVGIPIFPPLVKGDTIGVAAPSGRFDIDRLKKGVAWLEGQGFKVHVPREIFMTRRYLAGPDEFRAKVLNNLFQDPSIKGIIAARGGFGAMKILAHLDWPMIRENPTLVMGFSDVTALLNPLVQTAGVAGIHGPNLVSLAQADSLTLSLFMDAVKGFPKDLAGSTCLFPGHARGMLKGGNLATLVHMIGTPFQPQFSGAVLFLEDVGEPAYKIDRMLSQMSMAGLLEGVQGVVTGSFEDCGNPEYIPDILLEFFSPMNIPLLMGLESGHGPVNQSLVMGAGVELDAQGKTLKWNQSDKAFPCIG